MAWLQKLPKPLRFIIRTAWFQWLAHQHGADLQLRQDHTAQIRPGDLLACVVLRNEAVRIPYFLAYYRALGINHFLFIDNGSDDGLPALLAKAQDCSVWHTQASYKAAKFGVHWQNYLLSRFGNGHWCLTVDPDEFLVYPYCDSRTLRELTAYLDQEGKTSFFTLMLDMYSDGALADALYEAGQNPLDVCPWFDATGYVQEQRPNFGEWWLRGGARRRVFFADQPELAPALNKTVLVKWRRHYAYVSSTHIVWPRRLNRPHFTDTLAPTGCLLHFKYLALLREKVDEELTRQQHYADSREYQRYATGIAAGIKLWTSASVRFENWRQCVDLGLMGTGRWF